MKSISEYIQQKITDKGDIGKSKWLENYIKHDLRSKGVGIPDIREIVKEATSKFLLTSKDTAEQIPVLNHLMQQVYTEDKLAAIIYIQLYWKKVDPHIQLQLISDWFDNGWISDWNVCDWLCVRILSPLLDTSPQQVIPQLRVWNKNKNLWKARASLVPFAECKTIADYLDTIEEFSHELIKREERFCKTAVGWVLRQYSKADQQAVVKFLSEHERWMTQEVFKNATKYFRQK